ncbi:hypothetical protein JW710_03935 [Candidatus Dojkabacteria bacterium]|nr:hypothetical protein [Candidatus Dojkabacteria bacterium]
MEQISVISKEKKRRSGCFSCFVLVIFLGLVAVCVVILVVVISYRNWESENSEFLDYLREGSGEDVDREDLDKRLREFSESEVQREVVNLSCVEFETLVREAVEQGAGVEGEMYLICHERAFDFYTKNSLGLWVQVRMWQRADGDLDFAVYDVLLGPFSLANISFGWLNGEISRGLADAVDLVSSEDFSGRKIVEIYVEEYGVDVVGEKE